jgi:hypothetical protein
MVNRELGWKVEYGIEDICRDTWNCRKITRMNMREKILYLSKPG